MTTFQSWLMDPEQNFPIKGLHDLVIRIAQIVGNHKDKDTLKNLFSSQDFLGLLRHFLQKELGTGVVPQPSVKVTKYFDKISSDNLKLFNLQVSERNDSFIVTAKPFDPSWLMEPNAQIFKEVFQEKLVRPDWRKPIDPQIGKLTGYSHYFSNGQRVAVRSAELLPDGHSLVVLLPTGSGKSLITQTMFLKHGLEGGVTVCVVPTTALAIDQASKIQSIIKSQNLASNSLNLYWSSDLSNEERNEIKKKISEGSQGILFCSPESVSGALLPSLYRASEQGYLKNFIVDEAHLVVQWGDVFRPEFQSISGVRRGLMEISPSHSKFKTVLMSATMSKETYSSLKTMFADKDEFQLVNATSLRPEPQYWSQYFKTPNEKNTALMQVAHNSPRPLIIYTTKVEDSENIKSELDAFGFERVECYTGKTGGNLRRKILNDWSDSKLDIIVATSAFGVGIDKSNVRTVIHATVPETADRFYQEVGRGGRDGKVCGSLMLYDDADKKMAERMSVPGYLSIDKAYDRWFGMNLSSEIPENNSRDLKLVDTRIRPPNLHQETEYNQGWNVKTLVMMARGGLIEFRSKPPSMLAQEPGESVEKFDERSGKYWEDYFSNELILIKDPNINNKTYFEKVISAEISRSVSIYSEQFESFLGYLSGNQDFGRCLQQLYSHTKVHLASVISEYCGGCPYCRTKVSDHFLSEPAVNIISRLRQDIDVNFIDKIGELETGTPVFLFKHGIFNAGDFGGLIKVLASKLTYFEIVCDKPFYDENFQQAVEGIRLKNTILFREPDDFHNSPIHAEIPVISFIHDSRNLIEVSRIIEVPVGLHFIVCIDTAVDPFYPTRRLLETRNNKIEFGQFMNEVRV